QRHVRFEAALDRALDERTHARDRLALRADRERTEAPAIRDGHAPVLPYARRVAFLVRENGRGRKALHAAIHPPRRGDVSEGEDERQRTHVDLRLEPGREERLRLGPEPERAAPLGVEDGLFSRTIARDEEPSRLRVPDPDREHSVEALDHRVAPVA